MSTLVGLGVAMLIASAIEFCIAILLFFMTMLSPKYKKPALYFLLGSGITLLVSFGLCSIGAKGGGNLGL